MSQYFRIGSDGKVIPGVTILRDPQTGQLYDVEVVRGEAETDRPMFGYGDRSSLFGGVPRCGGARMHGRDEDER